jgi:hypothetical protein
MTWQTCACCGKLTSYPVRDHNHKTGKFRAVLCNSCNTLVGFVEGFLEGRYEKHIQYLKNFPDTELDYDKLTTPNPPRVERNKSIAADYLDGKTLQELSDQHDISRERVRQIVDRYSHNIPRKRGRPRKVKPLTKFLSA